jgi:hypothetical protein
VEEAVGTCNVAKTAIDGCNQLHYTISMEQVCDPSTIYHSALNVSLVDSEQRRSTSRAVSKVFISHSFTGIAVDIDAFRRSLADRLRGWVECDEEPSQKHFWNFYDSIREFAWISRQDVGRNLATHEIAHYLLTGCRKLTLRSSPRRAVIDGQHRVAAFEKTTRDLSGRAIRSVLQTTLDRLYRLENAETISDVLDFLDNSLAQEVAKRINWVEQPFHPHLQENAAPSTHEWVLGFFVRTGNSPPRTGQSCPADGRAIVNTITEAWREGYATVQGQEDTRSLRNTICNRYTKARFNRSARSHASVGGSPQFARPRHSRCYYSLAQCA